MPYPDKIRQTVLGRSVLQVYCDVTVCKELRKDPSLLFSVRVFQNHEKFMYLFTYPQRVCIR